MTDKKTLEDALAEIEASNAKAAELRAKQAPELIAEAVKRTALNARLAALPQAQRRQVLDAAGMKRVSAAPEPITRLKGRGSSYTQPRTPAALPAIDWRYWRHMPEIKQWEACALSLNINPDNMQHSPQGWMAGPGSGPTFLAVNFPSKAVQLEFDKRVRLLGASLFKSPHFTAVNNLVMGGRHLATLRLTEFVAWCLSVELEMPPELKAMAATPQASKPTEPQAVPVGDVGASMALPKQRAQEARILELLKAQGHDPKRLSNRKPGTPGPKADIRALALRDPALFTIKTFDTAWQRLRDAGDVAGAE